MIIHFVNFLSHFLHSTARRGANYSTVSSVLVLNQYFWIWFHFLFENWSHSLRLKIEGTSRWNPEFHFIAGGFLKNILLVISFCDRQSRRPDNYCGRHVIQALSTGLFHDFQINKNVHTTYITSNKNQPGSTDFIHVKPFEPNRIKTNGMYQVDRTTNGFRIRDKIEISKLFEMEKWMFSFYFIFAYPGALMFLSCHSTFKRSVWVQFVVKFKGNPLELNTTVWSNRLWSVWRASGVSLSSNTIFWFLSDSF